MAGFFEGMEKVTTVLNLMAVRAADGLETSG